MTTIECPSARVDDEHVPRIRATWDTGPHPAAIGVLRLVGEGDAIVACVRSAFDAACPAIGHVTHARLGTIDDGVLARVGERVLLVMPHGGPRLRALIDAAVRSAIGDDTSTRDDGDRPEQEQQQNRDAPRLARDLADTWPEAADALEALALETLARSESALAVDVLLEQAAHWRAAGATPLTDDDRARSRRLDRLVSPPRVVVVGAANVGKSTLLNALAGRTVAIEADVPGTTRDAVGARLDLAGLAVDWFDTAGLREDAAPSERRAIELATAILVSADLVVELAAPGSGWPDADSLPVPADTDRIRVMTAADRDGASASEEAHTADVVVSGLRGDGIATLVARIVETLVPRDDRSHAGRWLFDPRLERLQEARARSVAGRADQSPTIE